ncbi:hypothetical protein PENSPDRAFT_692391 [Peniophora sp. CONT]|nr:hypothetical protein PENSPDRAFT_692391 [Peniophora sp. CONT]
MGVNGLWDVLRPAAQPRSHYHLAVVDGFEANTNELRGFRIGIDASIWFFHAENGREGENPELRTLFFRCTRLLNKPFLPVFVFDGPKRPDVKRGKRIDKSSHWMVDGMKRIIAAFGFEWRMAPGEAEAELAYLNSVGQIDAVLSDDVDTFLFGATMVVRNTSNTLSANIAHPVLNADGRDDKEHSHIYKASDILHHSSIQLTRGGMILIGLLSGGDYSDGVKGCGMKTAHGLARCGFGDELLDAVDTRSRDDLPAFLADWRTRIREELKTNSRGMFDKRMLKLAREWPEDFPDLDILYLYTNPVTSKTDASARKTHIPPTWKKEPDFGKIANVCEMYFEWGFEEAVIKRFRTVLWNSAIQRIFRRAALEDDARRRGESTVARKQTSSAGVDYIGTPFALVKKYFSEADVTQPEAALITKIHATRNHAMTDRLLEYRISILPELLVKICKAGLKGTRPPVDTTFDVLDDMEDDGDDDGTGKKKRAPKEAVDPLTPYRVWVPASIVRLVRPDLVEEFEGGEARKAAAKTAKAARAAEKQAGGGAVSGTGTKAKRATRKKAPADFPLGTPDDDVESFDIGNVSGSDDGAPSIPTRAPRPKPAPKARPAGKTAASASRSRKKAPAPFPSLRSDSIDLEDEPPRPIVPQPRPEPPASHMPLYLEDENSFDSAPLPQFNSRRRPPAPPPVYLEDEDSFDSAPLLRFGSQSRPASQALLYMEDEESDDAAPRPLFSSQPLAGPSNTMKGFFAVSKSTVTAKGKGLAIPSTVKRTVDLTARRSPEPLITTPSTVVSSTVTSAASTRIAASGGSAVLDRLDKAAARSRKFQRTDSSNSAISAVSSASAPRPFPLAFEQEEPFFSDDDQDTLPPPPLPLQRTHIERTPSSRRERTPSLTRYSDSDTPRKSPRHNTRHSSPRRTAIELNSSPTRSPPRRKPRSPPRRAAAGRRPPPTHRPRKLDDSIIEINSSSSSGDEDSPSVGSMIASVMGRAPAPQKGTTSRTPLLPTQPGRAPPSLAGDVSVIDLT